MGRKPFAKSGQTLKEIRKEFGLTQKEMGKILEMHTQFVSNAERGMSFITKKAFNSIVSKLVTTEKFSYVSKLKNSIKEDLYSDFINQKLEAKNAKRLA